MSELFIDGGMLQQGNREAVRQTCAIAVNRLLEIANTSHITHDDVLDHLTSVLQAIASGTSPDEAFGWATGSRGRSPSNFAFRDWIIRMAVRDRMRSGESRESACGAVSTEVGGDILLSFESIKKICRGVTAESDLPLPENIFPIDPMTYVVVKLFRTGR